MAGIYIHIPFCKKACHYCDFHFSTSLANKTALVNSIIKEIEIQKDYLQKETIETIYFGGGTPSLLSEKELNDIFNTVSKHYEVAKNAEITLEANPDDITTEKLILYKSLLINRLSIGIQSFYDPFLTWMNRAHNGFESENAVYLAQSHGFDNISIDLIYGIPHSNHTVWQSDLQKAMQLKVNHIAAYSLTIENNTVFGKWRKANKIQEATDEFSASQFEMLQQELSANNYIQYEISNFAKEGHFSKHNSAYWKGIKYLGIGPSAHSFDGTNRQANIANNTKYIEKINSGKQFYDLEILTDMDKANDYLLTSLRTIWGTDINYFNQFDGIKLNSFHVGYQSYIKTGHLLMYGQNLTLTNKGKFIADKIIRDLFFV